MNRFQIDEIPRGLSTLLWSLLYSIQFQAVKKVTNFEIRLAARPRVIELHPRATIYNRLKSWETELKTLDFVARACAWRRQ